MMFSHPKELLVEQDIPFPRVYKSQALWQKKRHFCREHGDQILSNGVKYNPGANSKVCKATFIFLEEKGRGHISWMA
jgi:hypothetical protein